MSISKNYILNIVMTITGILFPMITFSSEDFEMSRIDFYEVNGHIYFGEVTFTSEAGTGIFYPNEWDYKLGEMWEIKECR